MPRKGSRRTCEICGVKEAHSETPLLFANYPLDETRCREWVRVTGNEDLVHIPIEKLNTIKHVCGAHFKPKDFNKSKNRLKKRAVPCLQLISRPLPDDKLSGFPLHLKASQGKRNQSEVSCENKEEEPEDDSVGDPEVLEEPIEEDVHAAGPFTWQQSSAVVPCDEDEVAHETKVEKAQFDSFWADDLKKTGTVTVDDDAETKPTQLSVTHTGYHCNACEKEIIGYRYVCVQCPDFDLCAVCEAAGRHQVHYVLRVPHGKAKDEIETILHAIRTAIANCILHLTDDGLIEVKKEDVTEDPIAVEVSRDDSNNSDGHEDTDNKDPDPNSSHHEDSRVPDSDLDHIPIDRRLEKTPSCLKSTKGTATPKTSITLVLEPVATDPLQLTTSSKNNTDEFPSDKNTTSAKIVSLPTKCNVMPKKSQVKPTKGLQLSSKYHVIPTKSNVTPTDSNVSSNTQTVPTKGKLVILKKSSLIPTTSNVITLDSNVLPTKSQTVPTTGNVLILKKGDVIPAKGQVISTKGNVLALKKSDLIPTKSTEIPVDSNIPTDSNVLPTDSRTIIQSRSPVKSDLLSTKSVKKCIILPKNVKCVNVSSATKRPLTVKKSQGAESVPEPSIKKSKEMEQRSPQASTVTSATLLAQEAFVRLQTLTEEEINSALHGSLSKKS